MDIRIRYIDKDVRIINGCERITCDLDFIEDITPDKFHNLQLIPNCTYCFFSPKETVIVYSNQIKDVTLLPSV